MKKFLELISEEMGKGFEAAGYEAQLGRVTVSNRPDLCEYQCNGAMAGAKKYHKAPIMIANDVAEKLTDSAIFSEVSAVAPGFLNLKYLYIFRLFLFEQEYCSNRQREYFGFLPDSLPIGSKWVTEESSLLSLYYQP